MKKNGGKKIKTSKTILGTETKRRFGTMGISSNPRESSEQLDKESKVSKKQWRHPNKGWCNNRWRVEMKDGEKSNGDRSLFVEGSMTNSRPEEEGNEQSPEDLDMEKSF